MNELDQELLYGAEEIGKFLRVKPSLMTLLLATRSVPYAYRVDRPEGGLPMWHMRKEDAQEILKERAKTPRYDYGKSLSKRLLVKYYFMFEPGEHKSVNRLVELGVLTLNDWCEWLYLERKKSRMDEPMLMHPDDLREWQTETLNKRYGVRVLTETEKIFRRPQ